jgi:hypothetical protein
MRIMMGRGMAVERLGECGGDVEVDDRSEPDSSDGDQPRQEGDAVHTRHSPRHAVNICDISC